MSSATVLLTEVLKEVETNGRGNADSDNERERLQSHSLGLRSGATNVTIKHLLVQSSDTQTPELHHCSRLNQTHTHTLLRLFLLFVCVFTRAVQQKRTHNHPSWLNKTTSSVISALI